MDISLLCCGLIKVEGNWKKYLLTVWKYLRVVQRQIWLEVTRSKISRIIAGQRSPINNPDPPLGATLSPQHSINTTSFHSKSPENFDKIIPRVPFLLWFRPPPPCGPVLFNRGCWSVFQVYLNICSPVRGPVVQALTRAGNDPSRSFTIREGPFYAKQVPKHS